MRSISHRLIDTGVHTVKILGLAATKGAIGLGLVTAVVLVPLISAIALPVLALKALPAALSYWEAYKATLVNDQRVKCGRREGEDYTRVDAHVVAVNRQSIIHEEMGSFLHGQKNYTFIRTLSSGTSTFQTTADKQWLQSEKLRVNSRAYLESDLKLLRASCKGLIPIAGVLLAGTEILGATGSSMRCRGCAQGMDDVENLHWSQHEALNFHIRSISGRAALT